MTLSGDLVVAATDFGGFGFGVVVIFVLVRLAFVMFVVVKFLFKTIANRFETFFTAVESWNVKLLILSDLKRQSCVGFGTWICCHTTDGTSVLTLAGNSTVVRKLVSVLTILLQKVNVLKTIQLMHRKMRRNNTMI